MRVWKTNIKGKEMNVVEINRRGWGGGRGQWKNQPKWGNT